MLEEIHRALGVPADYEQHCKLPRCSEAHDLVSIGRDMFDRPQKLSRTAAGAWRRLRSAANRDRIDLQLVSAFRSLDYQAKLIRTKLEQGQAIGEILCSNAAPGFSEHHTGRAVDISAPGSEPLEEEFEHSDAFAWLSRHAARYGFRMTYPRDNPWGVVYEPWHWSYVGGKL